ncbi:MAG: DUF177 domain-containing protein [Chloroflexi bacterium]|nr:DUF177 domain-containing protein [Chloroflexota bacterium]
MIVFNVAQLLKQNAGATRDYTVSDRPSTFSPDLSLLSPVEGQAHLTRTSRGIIVEAQYTTDVQLECGRCLEAAEVPVAGDIADEFMPSISVWTGVPMPEQADSSELRISENHELDLTEVIRQDILTRLPLQPFCRPDCPGLCEQCGAPLASERCDCPPPATDSGLGKLAELFKTLPGQTGASSSTQED